MTPRMTARQVLAAKGDYLTVKARLADLAKGRRDLVHMRRAAKKAGLTLAEYKTHPVPLTGSQLATLVKYGTLPTDAPAEPHVVRASTNGLRASLEAKRDKINRILELLSEVGE